MSGLAGFLLFAALFFFMMRFGCGSHVGHGGHGDHGDHEGGGGASSALGTSTDPVCGMRVEGDTGYARAYRGATYRFCSRDCLDKFDAEPEKYGGAAREATAAGHAGSAGHGGHGA